MTDLELCQGKVMSGWLFGKTATTRHLGQALRMGTVIALRGGLIDHSSIILVHVWIGGDMGPGTSPNDPAFFLNHCNVDRIWEAWMASKGRIYRPGEGVGPAGHRINDLMVAILGDSMRPQDVLDPTLMVPL